MNMETKPIIDCHAHAMPGFGEFTAKALDKLSKPLADQFRGIVQPFLQANIETIKEILGSGTEKNAPQPILNTQRLAQLRKAIPGQLAQSLELTLSAIGVPMVMFSGTIENLVASMDRFGITKTFVIASPPFTSNNWLLSDASAIASDRMIAVCSLPDVDEDAPDAQWANAFESLLDSGALGLKIHPNTDNLSPAHHAYRTMFEIAHERNVFIILHTGAFSSASYKHNRPADPLQYKHLFKEFPEVRVCLAHMNRDNPDVVWGLMKEHEQLYTDTSWQPKEVIENAIRSVGSKRILLGSDWPLLHSGLQGNAVDLLRHATSDIDFEAISQTNPARFVAGQT